MARRPSLMIRRTRQRRSSASWWVDRRGSGLGNSSRNVRRFSPGAAHFFTRGWEPQRRNHPAAFAGRCRTRGCFLDRALGRIVVLPVSSVRPFSGHPMTQSTPTELNKTPLSAWHRAHGARMVAFVGWDMPVEYSGISEEHNAVRTRAGLFDVTHMGQVEFAGPDALAAVQRMASNDASKLKVGQAQYSALTTPQGTFVDDMLVYRFAENHFLTVVNASNVDKDFAWMLEQAKLFGDVSAVNTSARYALLALQGPASRDVLQSLTDVDL